MLRFHFARKASPILLAAVLAAGPLFGQVDLSGNWRAMFWEDQPERIPGPELGDYLGMPINDAARLRADSWSPSRLTMPEQQCRVHVSPYIYRGPTNLRIWEEKDPETQALLAIRNYSQTYEQNRTIWMDGRPHPPEYALHTWMGFSTGKWEGDVLTVYTTHIKTGWVRRNGLPESDHATLTEHFIRHGDILTHVSIVSDPAYLTEPLIKSQDFMLDLHYNGNWLYPCESVEEVVGRPEDAVPNFLPGENPFLKEYLERHPMVPQQASRGGAETMLPEYRQKMKAPAIGTAGPGKAAPTDSARLDMAVAESHGLQNQDFSKAEIHVLPVQGNIYMLVGDGANITLQAGKQGALVVNTGFEKMSDKLIAAIRKLSERPLQYIINTNFFADNTGGNEPVKYSGTTITGANVTNDIKDSREGAQILAHENVLDRMSAPTGTKSPTPSGAWPTDTFIGKDKPLYFNGESIQIINQPNANTDGDSIVYFRRSDVISAGDLFNTDSYPVIDVDKGGSIQGVVIGLTHIVKTAIVEHEEEGGTLVIPGHGHLCDQAEVVEYRDMVAIVRDRIQAMIKKGMTLEQVKAARPTLDYDPLYGHNSFWTPDMFVEAAYKSLVKK